VSNAVSLPIDNLIFAVGAFGALPFLTNARGTLPWDVVWDIFWVNLWVKGLVSVLSMPLIYITPVSAREQ
jgi:queuosine precursor transporter